MFELQIYEDIATYELISFNDPQTQLHVVLSLNTVGGVLPDSLTQLFATYPCLVKKCTCIDSYSLWPADTLAEIANTYLIRYNKEEYEDQGQGQLPGSSPEFRFYLKMLSNLAASVHLVALCEGRKELKEIRWVPPPPPSSPPSALLPAQCPPPHACVCALLHFTTF